MVENRQSIERGLDKLFSSGSTCKSTSWTKQGSSKGLVQKLVSQVENDLNCSPENVVIHLKKLHDGGYEVTSYRSL